MCNEGRSTALDDFAACLGSEVVSQLVHISILGVDDLLKAGTGFSLSR